MGVHPIQLLVIVIVALLVFGGRGRISSIMGDLAKGVRSFREGIKDPNGEGEDKKPMVDVTPDDDKKDS